MKAIIPGDWDGETWRSACIEFPDSPEWAALMRGLLYGLTRGRTYDERTGDVRAVAAIGWEILNRAWPWVVCGGGGECPECPDCPDCQGGGGEGKEESEDDMGVQEVKVEGDYLVVVYSACCEKRFKLADAGVENTTPDGDDPADPDVVVPGDPEGVDDDIQCKNAAAVARAMRRVHDEVEDAWADVIGIVDIGNRIASRLPEYTVNKYQCAQAGVLYGLAVTAGTAFNLVLDDPDNIEQALAAFMRPFMEKQYRMAKSEYEALCIAILGFGAYSELDVDLEAATVGAYWQYILKALGQGTVNELCQSARFFEPGDYDCSVGTPAVEFPEIPETADWVLDYRFSQNDQGMVVNDGNQSWSVGVGWLSTDNYYTGGVTDLTKEFGTKDRTGTLDLCAVEYEHEAENEAAIETGQAFVEFVHGAGTAVLSPVSDVPVEAGDHQIIGSGAAVEYSGSANRSITIACRIRDTNGVQMILKRLVLAGTGFPPA